MNRNLVHLMTIAGMFLGVLACEDPSSLIPIEDLPFEYQLELKLSTSTCAQVGTQLSSEPIYGTMNLGKQDQAVVALIKAPLFTWRLEGLKCEESQPPNKSLCLASRESLILQSIMRAPGIRDELDGQLACTLTRSIPDTAFPMGESSLRPSDLEWQEALAECCTAQESNAQAIYLPTNESSIFQGELSVRHKLSIELPLNGQPNSLSSDEYQGALTACGGPVNCIDRFYLYAEPAQ